MTAPNMTFLIFYSRASADSSPSRQRQSEANRAQFWPPSRAHLAEELQVHHRRGDGVVGLIEERHEGAGVGALLAVRPEGRGWSQNMSMTK